MRAFHRSRAKSLITTLAAACGFVLGDAANAQTPDERDPLGLDMTRATLEELLDGLAKAARSPAYSQVLRSRARAQADEVRARLEQGDFAVGDRILLVVETQPTLTDTFTVDDGQVLTLPTIGEVPLRGVIRAELGVHLQDYVSRYVRQPRLRAEPMMRVAIMGAVVRPGFYIVSAQMLVAEVIMVAGGPGGQAITDEIRVERAGRTIWDADRLRQAMIDGRTLEQLSLREGDYIVVPQRGGASAESTLRIVTFLLTVPVTLAALASVFN